MTNQLSSKTKNWQTLVSIWCITIFVVLHSVRITFSSHFGWSTECESVLDNRKIIATKQSILDVKVVHQTIEIKLNS